MHSIKVRGVNHFDVSRKESIRRRRAFVKKSFHFLFYYFITPTEQDFATAQDIAKGAPLWPGYSCKVDVIQAHPEEQPNGVGRCIYSHDSLNRAERRAFIKGLRSQA
jgi:hypothetical protein